MSENTITVEELKQTIEANYIQDVHTVWHGLNVYIKKHLSMQETIDFVESVARLCFAADTDEYIPEVKDYAIRRMVIEKYTNFELPDDADEQFDILYSSELVPFVIENIDRGHFESMVAAAEDKIEYIADSHVGTMMDRIDQITTGFEELEKSLSDLFGGIDADTIMKISGALAGGGFDVEKLAKATFEMNNSKDGGE